MSTAPSSITVHTTPSLQSAATIRHLERSGVAYDAVPADALRVAWTDADGVVREWSGFRADRLDEAVGALSSAA